MNHPNLAEFNSDAHLIDDLAIESSQLLELLMHMELDYELEIPEESLMNSDFETVRNIVELMFNSQNLTKIHGEWEVSEKPNINSLASCLSEIVKRRNDLDHRILCFGICNTNVSVNDKSVLLADDDMTNHNFLTNWYDKLYGIQVSKWYDKNASVQSNTDKLITLVESKEPLQHIIVMLDMLKLPKREDQVNKALGPHYVMLGPTSDPELWFMYDPDFQWEGVIEKNQILNAINLTTAANSYLLSETNARPSTKQHIDEYFSEYFSAENNSLNNIVRELIVAHTGNLLDRGHLNTAFKELPYISSKLYAYKYGFSFFWSELLLPKEKFNYYCEEIKKLTKTYELIYRAVIEYAHSSQPEMLERIISLMDQQDATKISIKQALKDAYTQWHQTYINDHSIPKKLEVPA